MMKKGYLILSFLIFLISFMIYNEISYNEYFKNVEEINFSNKTKCKKINSNQPIEDFVKINDEYIIGSSTIYLKLYYNYNYLNHKGEKGTLILLNLKNETLTEIPIENYPRKIPFNPHGISLLDGHLLYIINHAYTEGERIEVVNIEFSPLKLKHVKSIKLPNKFFGTLNSIAAIDKNTFFFTTYRIINYPVHKNEVNFIKNFIINYSGLFTRLLSMKLTNLYIYSNNKINKINGGEGIVNNGLAYNKKDKILFMAQTFEKNIKVFKLGERKFDINFIKDIKSNYCIDNLDYDEKNNLLYAGIIGKMYSGNKMAKNYFMNGNLGNEDVYGGLEVIDPNNNYEIKDVYLLKNKLKGISSGSIINNKLIFSSVYDKGMLICEKEK